mmetsp:Transcript_15171/g.32932  ORF Transcript_15171/g.32932 Transcript_15171/m.32932 type:complete len:126 (+) Transcript_15171:1297-1674(+)
MVELGFWSMGVELMCYLIRYQEHGGPIHSSYFIASTPRTLSVALFVSQNTLTHAFSNTLISSSKISSAINNRNRFNIPHTDPLLQKKIIRQLTTGTYHYRFSFFFLVSATQHLPLCLYIQIKPFF